MPGSRTSVDHLQRAEDLSGQIAARRRFADDLEMTRILNFSLPRHGESEPELAVPVDRRIEMTASNQLGVGDAFGRVSRIVDNAIADGQPLGRNAKPVAGHLEHDATRFRRRLAENHAGTRNADRGAGAAHVDRAPCVAHDDVDALQRDIEFLGDHLGDRGL